MSSRNWTDEQNKALDATGTLTVLSAAAGSGKTTVLVEKALRIILDQTNKISADKLLIATFSNASAKEFKNRIEQGINKAIKQDPNNLYIKSQKMALQKADISTIHAFCIKLVRENFEQLDISPDFTICDDAKAMTMHEKAIDKAMEYGYSLKDFAEFASMFGKSSQDKQIREFLKDMHRYFSALPFPTQKAKQTASLTDSEDFAKTAVYKSVYDDISQQIDYLQYLADRQKQLCEIGDVEEYEQGIVEVQDFTDKLKTAFLQNEIKRVQVILSQPSISLGRVKKKSEFSTACSDNHKLFKDIAKQIKEDIEYLDGDRYAIQYAVTRRYIHALTKTFLKYSDELLLIKKQEKSFEFSDFEHFAVQLLIDEKGEKTSLALELQEKYAQIMEDEFQDTSFVQDMIFTSIAKEKEKNLFVVGDVKQSIYGFRKASPEILLEKRARHLKDPNNNKTIVLPHNFRSEIQVIDAVNFLFEKIMTQKVGGVNYKDGEQLKAPLNKEINQNAGGEILICAVKKQESEMVAQKIYSMLEQGFEIQENSQKRKVTASDFCILLRNTSHFDEYVQALKAKGIESFVRDDELILNKAEVQNIISVLRIINNPLQEVYLTAGMFGDLFEFSLDEILKIRLTAKKENLYKAAALSDLSKAQDFLKDLKDFSQAAVIYSPDKLISYIINKTGYYSRLAFGENGAEKRENVRWFISFAKNYAKNYQTTLSEFLRYIDLYIQSGKGVSQGQQKIKDAVSIMTMHTSKGLEFPVCFVSGLATQFNKMDRGKKLMIDQRLGMATFANEKFGYNKSTIGIKAIKNKILSTSADDEMRLLYVALTRSKYKLFLTAEYNNIFTQNTLGKLLQKTAQKPHPYAVLRANSPIEWVLLGYLNTPCIADDVFVKKDKSTRDLISFTVVDSIEQETEPRKITPKQQEKLFQDIQKMQDNFNFEYPDKLKTMLPIKLSVGEIAKAPMQVMLKKPFFAVEQKASATQKGSAMHSFVQHADILLARTNLENEVERLSAQNLIDKELINIKQISRFVLSEVATIILNAKTIYKEKEFLVPYNAALALGDESLQKESILLQGVIDCVAVNGDKAVIIDYKTDRVENVDILKARYQKQLELYRYAAQYLFEIKEVECIIYSFYLDEYIRF